MSELIVRCSQCGQPYTTISLPMGNKCHKCGGQVVETLEHFKSQFNTWMICPAYYKYLWIDGMPNISGVEMQFGTMFHTNTQLFFVNLNYTELKLLDTYESTVTWFKTLIDSSLPEHVHLWMERFTEWEAKRWMWCKEQNPTNPIYLFQPVGLELELGEGEYHIDRVDRVSLWELMVIDYKTDKWFHKSILRRELCIYYNALRASKKFSEEVNYIGAFLPQLNKWYIEKVKPSLVQTTNRRIAQFRNARRIGEYPYRPSNFCRYCARLSKCLEEGVFGESIID